MTERVNSVDALRAFALFGIAVVNMPFLGGPFGTLPDSGLGDIITAFAISLLFQAKFFLLFAFLFGWGLGVQQQSAARAGVPFGPRFWRRQAGLALIGVAHATLVFAGDILMTYALVGVLLFAIEGRSQRALVRLAALGIGLGVICLVALTILIADASPETAAQSGYLGGFAAATGQRIHELQSAFPFILMFNGPLVFAAFCAGLAAQRSGFLKPDNALFARLAKRRWTLLMIGIVANLPFAMASHTYITDPVLALLSVASLAVAAPLLSLAYLMIVANRFAHRPPSAFTAAGRMSLTAYVLAGVIAGFIFNGYGLGWYGQLGSLAIVGIAVGVYLTTELICALCARTVGMGPLERVLRAITYE